MGCLGINSICEFGVSDSELRATSEGSLVALSAVIESLIEEAQRKCELSAHVNAKVANSYIGCVTAGLKAGRARASSDTLREVGEMAMTALTGMNPR